MTGWSSFLWPLSCPVFEACLLQAALHSTEPAQLSIHPCFCKAKNGVCGQGQSCCQSSPSSSVSQTHNHNCIHLSLGWFRSTFDLKLNQMKTNLLPDSHGEVSLILSSPAVKLPHLPFADFRPGVLALTCRMLASIAPSSTCLFWKEEPESLLCNLI